MSYTLNLGKLLSDITGPKGLAALTEEIHKIRNEVDRLKHNVQPQAEKKLKAIQVRLNGLRNTLVKRRGKFEKELDKTLNNVKRVAKDAESRIQTAIQTGKKRTTKKSAGAAKTRKKKRSTKR